jgi:uncharacterized protein YqgC (DUF456 family)
MDSWLYYLWAIVLLLACGAAWVTTLFSVPGNWLIAGFAALFAWLLPAHETGGIGWITVFVLLGLAGFGEVIEFAASAAGAAKQGASKRGIALSMAGAVVGSILGIMVGLPIPILGSFVMAVLGGAAGAFAGAYFGEAWKGRGHEERIAIGRGAFTGRIWGTIGKLAVGAVMLVVVAWDAFF